MIKVLTPKMENNRDAYNRSVSGFGTLQFYPAEMLVLEKFRDQWKDFAIVDLGVGVGRTSWMLSQQSRSYLGIDYAENRIDQCEALFPKIENRSFEVGDARDLSTVKDGETDFVIFSYNGIDYIDSEGRKQALSEIHRILKPGGWFFFSSHSLDAYPFRQKHPRRLRGFLTPLGWIFCLIADQRMKWINRSVDLELARKQGWACLSDYASTMMTCYVDPKSERKSLEKIGFELDSAWDLKGDLFDFEPSQENWMIQYLARKSP